MAFGIIEDDAILEIAITIRESQTAIAARIAAQQLGEDFAAIEEESYEPDS